MSVAVARMSIERPNRGYDSSIAASSSSPPSQVSSYSSYSATTRGNFGLSPRTSSAVVRPLSSNSQQHPRIAPSPRVPAYAVQQSIASFPPFPTPTHSAATSTDVSAANSPSAVAAGISATVTGTAAKRRANVAAHCSEAETKGWSDHKSNAQSKLGMNGHSDSYPSFHPSSHRVSLSSAPTLASAHDLSAHLRAEKEKEEYAAWAAQQEELERQKRQQRIVRWTVGGVLAIVVVTLLVMMSSSSSSLSPSLQTQQLRSSFGGGATGPILSASELALLRERVRSLSAAEAERMRRDMLELDASSLSPSPSQQEGEAEAAVEKLTPVTRAEKVIPPPMIDAAAAAAAGVIAPTVTVADAKRSSSSNSDDSVSSGSSEDESPSALRRFAEAQVFASAERQRQLVEREASAGGGERHLAAHGSTAAAEEEAMDKNVLTEEEEKRREQVINTEGREAVPQPSAHNHLTIEQLLHSSPTVRPHPHHDHPSIPKAATAATAAAAAADAPTAAAATATAAALHIPMPKGKDYNSKHRTQKPVEEKKEKADAAKKDGKEATPATAAAAAATTDAAAATAVAPAPIAEDDSASLLSSLASASHPSDVSSAADAVSEGKAGQKGPVQRNANAQAAQVAETVDMMKTSSQAQQQQLVASASSAATPTTSSSSSSSPSPPSSGLTVLAIQDAAAKKASEAAWASLRGQTLGDGIRWPPSIGSDMGKMKPPMVASTATKVLGADVQVIVLTSLAHQQLARRLKALYTPIIERLAFVSDHPDRGLDAIVLKNPNDSEKLTPTNGKEKPWLLTELLRHLLRSDADVKALGKDAPAAVPPAKFYIVMRDITFPLFDQIAWRLDSYTHAYGGRYPSFAGGRKTQQQFTQTYYAEQQQKGKEEFEGKKLFVVPSYIYGFDHHFLEAMHAYTSSDACPLLATEGLALAGLVECAGGNLENTEYDFFVQTRSNHREKKLHPTQSPLSDWRYFDAYNGCNTPGMLQEAYDAYYGKLQPNTPVAVAAAPAPTPASASAAQQPAATRTAPAAPAAAPAAPTPNAQASPTAEVKRRH